MGKIRVAIYEDNASFRQTLEWVIRVSDQCDLVGSHGNPQHILSEMAAEKPDVILMDIEMPGMTGIEALELISHESSGIPRVIMLTVFEDTSRILAAIKAGATGYLLKNTPLTRILESILEANSGGAAMSPSIARKVLETFQQQKSENYGLSTRETEVLKRLVEGDSYKLIAAFYDISVSTVEKHIVQIYRKLHVNSKGEAITKAIRDKII